MEVHIFNLVRRISIPILIRQFHNRPGLLISTLMIVHRSKVIERFFFFKLIKLKYFQFSFADKRFPTGYFNMKIVFSIYFFLFSIRRLFQGVVVTTFTTEVHFLLGLPHWEFIVHLIHKISFVSTISHVSITCSD